MADIFSDKMNIRSNAVGNILGALVQYKKMQDAQKMQYQQQDQAAQLQSQFPLFTKIPAQTSPNPDYINSLPSENQQPYNTTPERQQFNMQNLIALLQNGGSNPIIAGQIGGMAKAAEIGKQFAPQTTQMDPTKDTQTTDFMGNVIAQKSGTPKQAKPSGEFGNFLVANSSKYANDPNGLETAWQDFQNESMKRTEKKYEIQAKYRANRDGKSIGSYTAESGKKMTIWRNPDGSIVEIASQENVRPNQEGQALQKETNSLNALKDLSGRIEQSAKPEYLGGVVSGLSGNGMGGVLGSAREATGFIDDNEVAFRSDVASLKDQLLRARSGAQINEAEYQRLQKELPDVTQPKNVFDARMMAFKQRLQDVIKAKAKGKTTGGATPQQQNVTADPLGIR